jgi:hypothetical protein
VRKKVLAGLLFILLFTSCHKKQDVTYCRDIAPIIYKNCTTCHRPGSAGPFPLVTYRDAAKRSKMIAAVCESRQMPPWPADINYTHFTDEKVLSAGEINLIRIWSESGAPLGDTSQLPVIPKFSYGSSFGKPDLVVRMPEVFKIKGDNTDQFLLMKIPLEIPTGAPCQWSFAPV